jgi:succinyl-diaminopimelate desuccinylase
MQMGNFTPAMETALEDWLKSHERELIGDIKKLVRIPSVSLSREGIYPFGRECGQVVDAASELIRRYGFEEKNWDYYGISAILPGGKDDQICFYSHLDVVPAGDGWTGDPYEPEEKDGYLIGRGVQDNKGPAVALLYTLRFLKETKVSLRHSFSCFLGCNEESGMEDIPYFLSKASAPALSLVSDCGFPVCHGEKGRLIANFSVPLPRGNLAGLEAGTVANIVPDRATASLSGLEPDAIRQALPRELDLAEKNGLVLVTAYGVPGHAAFPEKSVNALQKLAALLLKSGLVTGEGAPALAFIAESFADFYGRGLDIPFEDQESGKTTHVGSLARSEGGTLKVTADIRYAISSPREEFAPRLRQRAARYGYTLDLERDSPPYFIKGDDPVVKELTAIACQVLGIEAKPYVMGGGTYARKLPRALGFGPGVPNQENPFGGAHQADEAQRIENLLNAIRIYVRSALKLDALVA